MDFLTKFKFGFLAIGHIAIQTLLAYGVISLGKMEVEGSPTFERDNWGGVVMVLMSLPLFFFSFVDFCITYENCHYNWRKLTPVEKILFLIACLAPFAYFFWIVRSVLFGAASN